MAEQMIIPGVWCSPDDMVVAAIISLQDPVGSHPEDISRWIEVRHMLFPLFLCSKAVFGAS